MTDSLVIAPVPVGSATARALLRAYLTDVADRWYLLREQRVCTPEEIERHLAEMPCDDLEQPRGVLLVARRGGEPAGCAGLRRLDEERAEVTRMYVRPAHRGRGVAPALLTALEETARSWGAARVVLETRLDLAEARALYARHGYTGIPAYVHGPHAEVWLGKELGGGSA
ncbi:GNAT family N-acetyltransferase [Streptomyces sp. AV19]|uniref:GNAT family N-acetyltransferase n=1 Tax=Streptomyces sp. AV19 TaxID=2793068 RepID=UPI0018FEA6F2|nr:GNAT family N-acetyltransferase [Streptomyces sp. AV19]MBH1935186.1 GNAT family N-acetyltransferase [Streptomyces sp. AV19]MDG4532014.1 GNAT family N-acetyltransferase [Streptomyces sp. AV19]